MKFTKMHGCGNDYVYINAFEENVSDPSALARAISNRHFGVGSDGLILIGPSETADVRMEMYNADGSEGKMCGNGIRCVAKYAYEHGLARKTPLFIETKAGIKQTDLLVQNDKVTSVTVDMGSPILSAKDIPVRTEALRVVDAPITVEESEYRITCVSMGNPHAVVFVKDTEHFPIEKIGPLFERHPMFPDRVNTEFIQVIDRNEINLRVWERGSGETMACGTGACAGVVACVLNGKTEEQVLVHLLGGDLKIVYDQEKGSVQMTGPAETVFEGEYFCEI